MADGFFRGYIRDKMDGYIRDKIYIRDKMDGYIRDKMDGYVREKDDAQKAPERRTARELDADPRSKEVKSDVSR